MASLRLGVDRGPLAELGLDGAQRPRGDRPTVHPADQPQALELRQIAAHRLGRHGVGLGQRGHGEPSLLLDQSRHGLLSLFCVHRGAHLIIFVYVVLCPILLLVKAASGYRVTVATSKNSLPTDQDPSSDDSPPTTGRVAGDKLRGTAVVPGVGHGPVIVAGGQVSSEAIAAFGTGDFADPDAAMAAYDDAAAAVAAGFVEKAERASGHVAEVMTASAGLANDRGLRNAIRKSLRDGDDVLTSVHDAVEQFVGVFTQLGGLMAERATDLRDIERRLVARLVGEPEPGLPTPDGALGPHRRGPRPSRHRRPRSDPRPGPGHRAGRPDQPHRDHRPPARHPLCRGRERPPRDRVRHGGPGRRNPGHGGDRARSGGGQPAGRGCRQRPRRATRPGPDRAGRPTVSRSRSLPTSPTPSPRRWLRRHRSRESGSSAPSSASSTRPSNRASRSRRASTNR